MSGESPDFAYVPWEWEDETQFHCPTCKGTGLINPLTDQNAVLCLSTMDCPHCDGTGEI